MTWCVRMPQCSFHWPIEALITYCQVFFSFICFDLCLLAIFYLTFSLLRLYLFICFKYKVSGGVCGLYSCICSMINMIKHYLSKSHIGVSSDTALWKRSLKGLLSAFLSSCFFSVFFRVISTAAVKLNLWLNLTLFFCWISFHIKPPSAQWTWHIVLLMKLTVITHWLHKGLFIILLTFENVECRRILV